MSLLLLILHFLAYSSPISWDSIGDSTRIVLEHEERVILHFWSRDNQPSNAFGQLSDEDPSPQKIRVTLPNLYLQAGTYTLRDHNNTKDLLISPPEQAFPIQVPSASYGILAYREGSYAYAPNYGGAAPVR